MRYDDDDDDDLNVRNRFDNAPPPGASGLAITSMILGICSVVLVLAGCGCGCMFPPFVFVPWGVAIILGIVGVVLGFMGNTPGSEGFAWTGIICSFVTIALVIVFSVLAFFGAAAFFAAAANQPR